MNIEPFADAIVDAVLFFELSPSEVVDEDAAVRMLEQIASKLRRLGQAEKAHFLARVKHLTAQIEPGRARDALVTLPEHLGLSE